MRKVCVDSNFLVWAIKERASAGQEYLIPIAKKVVEYLDQNKIEIVVPSLVVAELLSDIEDDDTRDLLADVISNNFRVIQYDVLCAKEFASLRVKMDKGVMKEHRVSNNIHQSRLKADYNICASAIATNCDAIITNNKKDFLKYSDGKIPIYTLEDMEKLISDSVKEKLVDRQQTTFNFEEIKQEE